MNSASIYWLSKKQTSVKKSSFISECVAMKIFFDYPRGIRYKLRIMGIPVSNPVFIYGDIQPVLCNTTVPDSTLKKKSNSITYHFVREGVTQYKWKKSYIKTDANPSDLMTKAFPAGINIKQKV